MDEARQAALQSLNEKILAIVDAETYEVVQANGTVDDWQVEAIDYKNDGVIYVARFSGPEAEQRAREYAAWKNAALLAECRP